MLTLPDVCATCGRNRESFLPGNERVWWGDFSEIKNETSALPVSVPQSQSICSSKLLLLEDGFFSVQDTRRTVHRDDAAKVLFLRRDFRVVGYLRPKAKLEGARGIFLTKTGTARRDRKRAWGHF